VRSSVRHHDEAHACAEPQACHTRHTHVSRLRRGTILVAVLVVVTLSALAGTTAMYYGEAAAAGGQVSLKRTRSRAMAWSGVQAVMAELDTQREQLLNGEAPLVTTQWQLYEEGGKRGIVRLVALEKDEAGLERWVVSEGAKLDLNAATAEMLGKLGLSEDKSTAVVSAREKGFFSVEELVRVAGLGEDLGEEDGTDETDDSNATTMGEEKLRSLLTVLAFDPNVQAGIDPGGADARGKLRVNLNTAWSEELGNAIRQRFGADAVASAKKLFDEGQKFKSLADLVGVLKKTGVPVGTWPAILDAFTVNPDPYVTGRVDINRASARLLAAIPGISTDAAEEMVRRRPALDSAVKRSVVWPLSEGILKEDEFAKAVDWMTTRSMQWRARVEVGVIEVDAAERGQASRAPELQERMVLETVIDVASERPRVAYLRDVTMMEAAGIMGEELAKKADVTEAREVGTSAETAKGPNVTAAEGGSGLDMDASLKLNASLDFGGEPAPEAVSSSSGGSESGTATGPMVPPPAAAPVEGKDRRIGRWRGGGVAEPAESKP
jgi:DNA uptake protein ComE-like DNA-binding protein